MGAVRQVRVIRWLFILIGLAILGGGTMTFFMQRARERSAAAVQLAREDRDLDEKFSSEKHQVLAALSQLREVADRARLEQKRIVDGVTSFSVWERDSAGSFLRVFPGDPNGEWEASLFKLLPLELKNLYGVPSAIASEPKVLPLREGEDRSLRLALFYDRAGAGTVERFTAMSFRPETLFSRIAMSVGRVRRGLVDRSGVVLAHSAPSEVGKVVPDFLKRIRESRATGKIMGRSWEGYPSTLRFEEIPGWDAYYWMERTHEPLAGTGELRWLSYFLLVVSGLGGAFFLYLGLRKPPPLATRVFENPDVSSTSEIGKFVGERFALDGDRDAKRIERENNLSANFASALRRASGDPNQLERKLVESASRTANSPALFFRYDATQGIAVLSADSGFPKGESPFEKGRSGYSFALGSTLVSEIHRQEFLRQKKNLGTYPALARILLYRLGISKFDAWPMIRAREPGLPGRLLGVLVVTHSGTEAVANRGFLGTLIDRTARHYDA